MAVHGCISPKFMDNADDDDEPIVFRRNSSSAQYSQTSSSLKVSPASQNPSLVKPPHVHGCISPKFMDNVDDDDEPIVFRRNSSSAQHSQSSSSLKACPASQNPSLVKPSHVHGCISPKFMDNVDDDDGPIVFRRNSSSAQHSQTSSSLKASPASQNPSLVKPPYAQVFPNCENIYSRRNKAVDLLKPSQVDLASTSKKSVLNDQQKVPINKPSSKTVESEDSDDDMPLNVRLSAAPSAKYQNSKPPLKKPKPEVENSDNSDDEKPLSFRISTSGSGAPKNRPIPEKKLTSSSRSIPSVSASTDSSMNEHKPFSSKLSSKHSFGVTTDESPDFDEDHKPLAARFQQNGFSRNGPQSSGKPLSGSAKRPATDADKSTLASNKKPKYSDGLTQNKVKQEHSDEDDNDDDYLPLLERLKKSTSLSKSQSSEKKVSNKVISKPFKKKFNKSKSKASSSAYSKFSKVPPGSGEGQKWTTLEHNGVIFPPAYKPHGVKMLYDGKAVDLTPEQEEVATMFAVMKDTDYAAKKTFITNFWNDWKQILGGNHVIKDFERCDFTPIYEWHLREKEKKKQMSTEEKKALKDEKLKQEEKYMWAIVDGVKEKVGNFRVEPPGLFRGRGEHPKMGKLKKRIYPHDITINIGKDAPIPECPIPGERWKEIKHDNTVTWLAFWNDPITSKEFKYVFLAASSALKGQSDKEKYEKARKLKDYIQSIRANYTKDFTHKDESKRQIAVATYLIDKLALRAGNEKDDDEADTVGCCTLKVENVALVPPNKIQFDFLGKDSIRYFNTVDVEPAVYKAIGDFRNGKGRNGGPKKGSEDLFDKLDTSKLNGHLKELMPGLTAKVFRTYNASITLDQMLNMETKDGTVQEKIAVYQTANKEVAIICNHQRSVSKTHDAQMSRLNERIEELKAQRDELKEDLSRARKGKPLLKDAEGKPKRNMAPEMLEKKLSQVDAKIEKMELDKKIKDDLKTVALGTSKINYLDPRITVAWCKRYEVPIEKIFNKSLLAKFTWAMDVDPSFRF